MLRATSFSAPKRIQNIQKVAENNLPTIYDFLNSFYAISKENKRLLTAIVVIVVSAIFCAVAVVSSSRFELSKKSKGLSS